MSQLKMKKHNLEKKIFNNAFQNGSHEINTVIVAAENARKASEINIDQGNTTILRSKKIHQVEKLNSVDDNLKKLQNDVACMIMQNIHLIEKFLEAEKTIKQIRYAKNLELGCDKRPNTIAVDKTTLIPQEKIFDRATKCESCCEISLSMCGVNKSAEDLKARKSSVYNRLIPKRLLDYIVKENLIDKIDTDSSLYECYLDRDSGHEGYESDRDGGCSDKIGDHTTNIGDDNNKHNLTTNLDAGDSNNPYEIMKFHGNELTEISKVDGTAGYLSDNGFFVNKENETSDKDLLGNIDRKHEALININDYIPLNNSQPRQESDYLGEKQRFKGILLDTNALIDRSIPNTGNMGVDGNDRQSITAGPVRKMSLPISTANDSNFAPKVRKRSSATRKVSFDESLMINRDRKTSTRECWRGAEIVKRNSIGENQEKCDSIQSPFVNISNEQKSSSIPHSTTEISQIQKSNITSKLLSIEQDKNLSVKENKNRIYQQQLENVKLSESSLNKNVKEKEPYKISVEKITPKLQYVEKPIQSDNGSAKLKALNFESKSSKEATPVQKERTKALPTVRKISAWSVNNDKNYSVELNNKENNYKDTTVILPYERVRNESKEKIEMDLQRKSVEKVSFKKPENVACDDQISHLINKTFISKDQIRKRNESESLNTPDFIRSIRNSGEYRKKQELANSIKKRQATFERIETVKPKLRNSEFNIISKENKSYGTAKPTIKKKPFVEMKKVQELPNFIKEKQATFERNETVKPKLRTFELKAKDISKDLSTCVTAKPPIKKKPTLSQDMKTFTKIPTGEMMKPCNFESSNKLDDQNDAAVSKLPNNLVGNEIKLTYSNGKLTQIFAKECQSLDKPRVENKDQMKFNLSQSVNKVEKMSRQSSNTNIPEKKSISVSKAVFQNFPLDRMPSNGLNKKLGYFSKVDTTEPRVRHRNIDSKSTKTALKKPSKSVNKDIMLTSKTNVANNDVSNTEFTSATRAQKKNEIQKRAERFLQAAAKSNQSS